jgi:hypothetical protein
MATAPTKYCISGMVDAPILAIMKILALAFLLALVFASSANAFLRPRFPHRTAPPPNRDAGPVEDFRFAH